MVSMIAVAGYHEVLVHKADGSGIAARLVGLAERIQKVAWSPDGKKIAVTGGSPARMGEMQVWDVEEKKLELSKSLTFDTIYGASWSPDGKQIAFGCGRQCGACYRCDHWQRNALHGRAQ